MSSGSTPTSGEMLGFDTEGIEVMIQALNKVDQNPQKSVNKGTSKAIKVLKRSIKNAAPVGKTGNLKKYIIIKAEKNRGIRGRKVRQVTFKGGKEVNALLQKTIEHPGALGGKNKKAYYPSSVEYGFLARAPGGGVVYYSKGMFQTANRAKEKHSWKAKSTETGQAVATQKVEGQHFLRDTAQRDSNDVKEIMIETTMEELEKIWKEAQHS